LLRNAIDACSGVAAAGPEDASAEVDARSAGCCPAWS
jgi:hypothetical protein